MTKEPIHIAMASNRRYLPGLRATTVSLIKAVGLDSSHYFFYYLDAMREIDLLISRSGRLYPVEIKMSANPGTDAMRHFTVIDEMGVERAPGCVLSLTQNPIPVRDKGVVVNVATLWGQGSNAKNVVGIIPLGVNADAAYRAHLEEKYL